MNVDVEAIEQQLSGLLGCSVDSIKKNIPHFADEDFEGFYTIAYDYYENGKYDEAVNFFRLLTLLDRMKKKNWIGLAASLQMLKEYEKSINAYGMAALIDQADPYIPFYAAECCFSMGDAERGLLALSAADKLSTAEGNFKGLRTKLSALRDAWSNGRQGE